MRVVIMILPLFVMLAACKSPTFKYIKQVDHNLPLYEFKIDATCSLYTRSICKDSSNFPIDCHGNTRQAVETGYIILSDSLKKVMVINNVPNRNQKFYEDRVVAFQKAIASDTVFINVFFFKQFRFGTLQQELVRRQMKFISAEKHPRTFLWNYDVADSLLKVASVADVVPDGQNIRYTDTSLYLVPTFRQNRHFKFVFQLPSSMTNVVSTNKSPARIFVHKKSKKNYITYIEFERPVFKDFRAIKFAANRMYAFSLEDP
jgi:hypothetical protein